MDAKFLTGQKETQIAARQIADLGPEEVVLTHRYAESNSFCRK
jgi:hypothetical protein